MVWSRENTVKGVGVAEKKGEIEAVQNRRLQKARVG